MEKDKLIDIVAAFVPEAEIIKDQQYATVIVEKTQLHKLAKFLKDKPETNFDYLFCETAVDYGEYIMMVYHLDSTTFRHQLVIKTKLTDVKTPELDSVCDIWAGAEYLERELFDLFGIRFANHPDLRKIFLDNDWVGFPMRKDYTDPVNIIER